MLLKDKQEKVKKLNVEIKKVTEDLLSKKYISVKSKVYSSFVDKLSISCIKQTKSYIYTYFKLESLNKSRIIYRLKIAYEMFRVVEIFSLKFQHNFVQQVFQN